VPSVQLHLPRARSITPSLPIDDHFSADDAL
jgi:hypothetical protein